MLGIYLVICFVCAQRRNEGFLVEADGLKKMILNGNEERDPDMAHVDIPLLGRFKNEDGEKWHVMVSANVTGSGIEVRRWIERLVGVLEHEEEPMGPAFCDVQGDMIEYWQMNNAFVKEVDNVQKEEVSLIDQTICNGNKKSVAFQYMCKSVILLICNCNCL
jgi:hypothetical protein